MNIGVFCSANDVDERYMQPARDFAAQISQGGHTLVYGGSDYGVMKVMADGVQQGGSRIIGISIEIYKQSARKNADEMIIAESLGERRTMMVERSDVIVAMVGGFGTLDELGETLELKKQNKHNKPIIVLNTGGFYDGLQTQMQRIADDGFLPKLEQEGVTIRTLDQYIQFVETPQQAMALIDAYAPSTAVAPKAQKKVSA